MAFKKGESGNLAGKPPGTLSKVSKIRQQLYAGLPEVLEVVRKGALEGDAAMVKLWLDKTLPNVKPVHAPAALPITSTTPDDEAADLIYQAGIDGEIDADHAVSLLHLIGSRRQLEAEITNEAEQQQIAEIKAKLFPS